MKKVFLMIFTVLLFSLTNPSDIFCQIGVDVLTDLSMGIPWSEEFNPDTDPNQKVRNCGEDDPGDFLDGGDHPGQHGNNKYLKKIKIRGLVKP